MPAFAADTTAASDSFVMTCPVNHLPRHADVVRAFHEYNLGKVFVLRQQVMHEANRACRGGDGRVQIVSTSASMPAANRLATR